VWSVFAARLGIAPASLVTRRAVDTCKEALTDTVCLCERKGR
jgi:hypothetical protein